MNTPLTTTGVLALLLLAHPLAAQSPDSAAPEGRAPATRLHADVRLSGGWAGNFTQAPVGAPRRDIGSTSGEARLRLPLADGRATVEGAVGGTLYQEFDPGVAARAALGWSGGAWEASTSLARQWRSPRVEVGDELGFADVTLAGAAVQVRPVRALQLRALGQLSSETYGASLEKDNSAWELGGAVRFRGFGSRFSPELGASVGAREVRLETEDNEQRAWWLSLRSAPSPALYLHLRYRNRLRTYDTADPAASNYGREDTRHQVTLAADVTLSTRWSWTGYYAWEDARSTKHSRTFDAQLLSTGLVYRLRGR